MPPQPQLSPSPRCWPRPHLQEYLLPILPAFPAKYRHPAQMKGPPSPKYHQPALPIHIQVPPGDITRPQKTVT